jgi:hypothetical protein
MVFAVLRRVRPAAAGLALWGHYAATVALVLSAYAARVAARCARTSGRRSWARRGGWRCGPRSRRSR